MASEFEENKYLKIIKIFDVIINVFIKLNEKFSTELPIKDFLKKCDDLRKNIINLITVHEQNELNKKDIADLSVTLKNTDSEIVGYLNWRAGFLFFTNELKREHEFLVKKYIGIDVLKEIIKENNLRRNDLLQKLSLLNEKLAKIEIEIKEKGLFEDGALLKK